MEAAILAAEEHSTRSKPPWKPRRPPATKRWPRPAGNSKNRKHAVERLYARWQELTLETSM